MIAMLIQVNSAETPVKLMNLGHLCQLEYSIKESSGMADQVKATPSPQMVAKKDRQEKASVKLR